MRLLVLAAIMVAALTLQAQSVGAQQQQPSDQSSQNNEEVVVTGERLRRVLQDFVADISAPANSGDHQIARWDHRICAGVFGLTHLEQAQFIVDRVAQRAFAIGLDAGAPGCRANIVIFVTPDANALAHSLATEYRGLMALRREINRHAPDAAALDRFVDSDRPVRWWHVSNTVSADGIRIGEPSGNMMESGGAAVRVFNPSRLHSAVRQDFDRVIIIVDARQATGHTLSALADYLAMVSLAQLSPTIETAAYPSVLNLFANDQSVAGMTNWDIAYLDGLYHAPRNAYSSRQQVGRIADRMDQTLGRSSDAPQAPAQPSP
ncbi:MAG: hypothetical protein WAU68_03925 [Vitreimonas sp.]